MNLTSQLPQYSANLTDTHSARTQAASGKSEPGQHESGSGQSLEITAAQPASGERQLEPWHRDAVEQAAVLRRELEQRQAAEAELRSVSPTVGMVLFAAGAIEFVIPITPLGLPLMIAGALILAPHSPPFGYIDRWLERKFPQARGKALQLACSSARCTTHFQNRFQADFERRYPSQKPAE